MTKENKVLWAGQLAAVLVLSASAAQASNVGVDLNVHLGGQPQQVIVPQPVYVPPPPVPQPVYVPPPPSAPPVMMYPVEEDIQFVYPSALGFYVAVGVPYDLFYLDGSYFLFREGRWLRSASTRGPWLVQRHRALPPGLRRYRINRIREYRNREYVIYNRDRDHYRGQHFRSAKELWRDNKEVRKAERREEKEWRKEQHREDKEQWKEEKRFEKEERRQHHGRD